MKLNPTDNPRQATTKRFLGKTDGFIDKRERAFEKAHLKAYLKGRASFNFGFAPNVLGQILPANHKVKQQHYYEANS
ncbi:MAG: hypothetical protein GY861_05440 [bacterium]|nr:hypothetical protein [bacterium]